MSKSEINTKITLENVRLSFFSGWDARAIDDGKGNMSTPKYSTAMLLHKKKDKAQIAAIEEIVDGLLEEFKAKGGKVTKTFKMPLRDGDEEKEDDENYVGHMFLNANSLNAPQIVDENVDKILNRDEVYSGCFANVSLNFYQFDKAGNKGIAAGLGNIQKVKDGPKLGGGTSATEDFVKISGGKKKKKVVADEEEEDDMFS